MKRFFSNYMSHKNLVLSSQENLRRILFFLEGKNENITVILKIISSNFNNFCPILSIQLRIKPNF